MSVFFSDQFAQVASRLASTAEASNFMSQVLGLALTMRDSKKQREIQAALATAAQTWGLEQEDINALVTIATDRLNRIVTDSAATRFAASSLVGTHEAASAHELLTASFTYDPTDFDAARTALVTIMDEIRGSADIAAILTQLRDLTASIPAFEPIHKLVRYRYTYALPRTPMSVLSLLASLRQYVPSAYPHVKIPARVPASKPQYRYYTIEPTFAESVTLADVMATLQTLERSLYALPVPNIDFTAYVNSNILSADSPFSPALVAPGRNLLLQDEFRDVAKILLVTDALSTRGSQLYSSLLSVLDKYRVEKDTAALFPTVRIMLETLICLVEHPLMVRNLLSNILGRADSLSMMFYPIATDENSASGTTFAATPDVMIRTAVLKWIELREKGLEPLHARAYDPVSSGVLFSPVLSSALPALLDFKLPSHLTLGVAPWYGRSADGAISVSRIPITREYGGKAVFTSIPARGLIDKEHAGPLSTLFPSVITHGTYMMSITPVNSSVDIGGLVSHFPLDELGRFGELIQRGGGEQVAADPTLTAALQAHVLSTTHRMVNGSSVPFIMAMSTRSYDQMAGVQGGSWVDVFSVASIPTATPLTDVPQLVSNEWYAVLDESFVVIFNHPAPIRHEVAEADVRTASSAAPIVVFQEHPIALASFVPIDDVLAAGASPAPQPTPAKFYTPANPVEQNIRTSVQSEVTTTGSETGDPVPVESAETEPDNPEH
jgi:hypothetical protein